MSLVSQTDHGRTNGLCDHNVNIAVDHHHLTTLSTVRNKHAGIAPVTIKSDGSNITYATHATYGIANAGPEVIKKFHAQLSWAWIFPAHKC